MSTTAEEIVADLDAAGEEHIGAPYVSQREAFMAGLWAVIAQAVAAFVPEGATTTPSDTVVAETTYGAASSAGVSADYSRADHTHGTPPMPDAGDVGADPAGTAAGLVATEAGTRAAADAALSASISALVPTSRTISTTAPLTGGGDLSANRTLSVSAATTSAAGVVELATDGEAAAGVVVQGNDGRLSDARAPLGTRCILPDAVLSLGSSYEIQKGHLLSLLADFDMGADIADAKATTPTGWGWTNTTYVTSATITGGELVIVFATGATQNWIAGTFTASRFQRSAAYSLPDNGVLYFRIKAPALNVVNKYFLFQLCDAAADTSYFHAGFRGSVGAGNVYTKYGPSAGSVGPALTTAEMAAGVWFRVVVRGRQVATWYSTSTSTTPPASGWTYVSAGETHWGSTGVEVEAAFLGLLDATGGTHEGTVSYYSDDLFEAQHGMPPNPCSGVGGYPTTGPAITLVASYDLGTSAAVVADADVRAALARVENTRERDTAAVTWSVVRGSSASPAAGAYAASGSVSISTTGRYFAVHAKITSDGTQAGSIRLDTLAIPVT